MISIVSNSFVNLISLLMHVNEEKIRNLTRFRGAEIRNFPCWGGKLQIKFPVRTKETEAIMVLLT